MRINTVNNYDCKQGGLKHNNNFKGTVSPEFVHYVHEIRNDCLESLCNKYGTTLGKYHYREEPIPGFRLINNVCFGILERAKKVMEKCFQPGSVLSVVSRDEKPYDACDIILVQNETMNKHLGGPAYDQGFVGKKGVCSPIRRLKDLQYWIKGKDGWGLFSEAYGKNFVKVTCTMGWDDISCEDYKYSADAVKEIIDFLKLERQYVGLLPSESPADKYTVDAVSYDKLISSLTKRVEDLEKLSSKQPEHKSFLQKIFKRLN